jgi:hypothetical protein
MSDDVEQRLDRLTIRGLRPETRTQVLAAVESELRGGSATATPTAVAPQGHDSLRPGQRPGEKGPTETTPTAPPANASPWLRWARIAPAAALLVGVGLNVSVTKEAECSFAQILGPPPLSKRATETAKEIEAATDAETGQWAYRQLTTPRGRGNGAAAYAECSDKVRRLIDQLQTVSKDSYHETLQEDHEMDRGHTRCVNGRAAYCQCRHNLADRCTA